MAISMASGVIVAMLQDGLLYALPLLLGSFSPNLDRLPLFMLRLATEVLFYINQEFFKVHIVYCGLFYHIIH